MKIHKQFTLLEFGIIDKMPNSSSSILPKNNPPIADAEIAIVRLLFSKNIKLKTDLKNILSNI